MKWKLGLHVAPRDNERREVDMIAKIVLKCMRPMP